MKDSWDKVFPVTPRRAASLPRQMERENEMIVISHCIFAREKRTAILLPGPVRQAIIMTDPCFL